MRTSQALTSALETRAGAATPAAGRIGPNAAIQLIAALRLHAQDEALRRIFHEAECAAWLKQPPDAMIDETAAARLHAATRRLLPHEQARVILADAGTLTGDYLLANRIPRFAQVLLGFAPSGLAASALLKAIGAHAWTFAGSGRFEARRSRGAEVRIYANPLANRERATDPICVWHAAVLERLFRALVSPRATVRETACCAAGAPCCQFEIGWTRARAARVRSPQTFRAL
jgi:divinyl protochlorophyllide a 8-vinyl-reductase